MPKFNAQLPDGSTVEIDAPNADSAMRSLKDLVDPDPDRVAARREFYDLKDKGNSLYSGLSSPAEAGLPRRFLQGATFGTADEILAAASTPLEMIKQRTLDPRKAYNAAKAREDVRLEDAEQRQGMAGTAMELLGGVGSGVGLARGGVTLARPGMGYAGRVAAATGEGAALGGVTGFASGSGIDDRLDKMTKGAATGAGVGGALTGVVAPVARTVAGPVINNIKARMNPQGYAEAQTARAALESGMSADDIARSMEDAAAAGKGTEFTVADALGTPGGRLMSTIARTPGESRTRVVSALDARQAAQARRVAGDLDEAGNLQGQTAAERLAARKAVRSTNAETDYGRARSAASDRVDSTPAVQTLAPWLESGAQPAAATDVQNHASKIFRKLTDRDGYPITDFKTLFNVKRDLDGIAQKHQGKNDVLARMYGDAARALDEQLAGASRPYAAARDAFRLRSEAIEAQKTGSAAAHSGRHEDTTRVFDNMRERGYINGRRVEGADQRQGFREGYFDRRIEQAQRQSPAADKTLPLRDEASRVELQRFAAPGRGPMLARRVELEQRMSETHAQARTGSRTADNLADEAAAEVSPEILGNIARGRLTAAGGQMVARLIGAGKAFTPEVKDRVVDILLSRQNPDLAPLIERVVGREDSRQRFMAALLRGASAGSSQESTRR